MTTARWAAQITIYCYRCLLYYFRFCACSPCACWPLPCYEEEEDVQSPAQFEDPRSQFQLKCQYLYLNPQWPSQCVTHVVILVAIRAHNLAPLVQAVTVGVVTVVVGAVTEDGAEVVGAPVGGHMVGIQGGAVVTAVTAVIPAVLEATAATVVTVAAMGVMVAVGSVRMDSRTSKFNVIATLHDPWT